MEGAAVWVWVLGDECSVASVLGDRDMAQGHVCSVLGQRVIPTDLATLGALLLGDSDWVFALLCFSVLTFLTR